MEKINLKCVGMDLFESGRKEIKFDKWWAVLKKKLPAKIGRILCIGNKNGFDRKMCDCFNVDYIHTSQDLNYQWNIAVGGIDYIFCFDVIEHLMNPLLFLEQLRKFNCSVIITYPRNTFTPFWGLEHFHEYSEKAFYTLVTEAGFEIQYHTSFTNRFEWWKYFKGFRKILRLVFLVLGYPKEELYILKVQDGYKKD